MESLDIEYIANNDATHMQTNENTSIRTISDNTKIIKINGKEYSLQDLFDNKTIKQLKKTNITLGKLFENDIIKQQLSHIIQNEGISNIWYSHKYHNGVEFQLSIGKDGRPSVKFYDPDLNTTWTTDYAFATRCNGERVWVFRVGRGEHSTTLGYCFNVKNGAFKRVNLNEVCLSLPSARQFRDEEECSFSPSFNWFLSAFTWDATYSVFEKKGVICTANGPLKHDIDGGDSLRDDVAKAEAHSDDKDEKYSKNKNSTKFNNIKCKINFEDIKPIILTQEQIEEEILEITDTIEVNPCYDVCEVWNKLESIKSNILNSLCLTKEEKKSIVDKISNIHNDIKSKRLLGEEYVFQEDYTDLLLSHNARVDPVVIFNQAQTLKMHILSSKSLTNARKNKYILRINKIQDSLGLLSMQQNRYLDDSGFRPHMMGNFYNNYGFTPMATFTNRAYASLNNMLSINNIQYPQRQPHNMINNLINTSSPFVLKYNYF